MEIDAIQQRAGDTLTVVFDLPRIAAALSLTIPIVAARAGICFREITKEDGSDSALRWGLGLGARDGLVLVSPQAPPFSRSGSLGK